MDATGGAVELRVQNDASDAPPAPRRARARTISRRACAAVGGATALILAFPPFDLWLLAPLGPAGLALAVRRNRSTLGTFGYGLLFGGVFFGGLLTWITNLGLAAWVLLVLLQAGFLGGLALLTRWLWSRPVFVLTAPSAWLGVEGLRARLPWGGFPWGRLGFSQSDAPSADWVAVGGVPLLGWLLAAVGAALAAFTVSTGRHRQHVARRSGSRMRGLAPRRFAMFGVLAGLTFVGEFARVPAATATLARWVAHAPHSAVPGQAVVAIVQGNVPRDRETGGEDRALLVTENHARATVELAAEVAQGRRPAPDLVVWPESSVDVDPQRDARVRSAVETAVRAIGVPILIGTILDAPDGRAMNAGQLWARADDGTIGPRGQYVKRHLVPFGEYVPFRKFLGGVGELARVQRDFVPGDGPQVLVAGALRIGDIICYEVAYDDEATEAVRAGANLLVVQSNNASFMRDGQSGETLQQLAMARLRAIEQDRGVLVATTTGISAVVAPDGTVRARTGLWRAETLTARVELRDSRTLAARLGAGPEYRLSAIALLALTRRRPRPAGVFALPGQRTEPSTTAAIGTRVEGRSS